MKLMREFKQNAHYITLCEIF